MFILKKGNQPGVYVPLRALFLVSLKKGHFENVSSLNCFLYNYYVKIGKNIHSLLKRKLTKGDNTPEYTATRV